MMHPALSLYHPATVFTLSFACLCRDALCLRLRAVPSDQFSRPDGEGRWQRQDLF